MEHRPVVCPRCESFIGSSGDLDSCPVCGMNVVDAWIEQNDEDTEED